MFCADRRVPGDTFGDCALLNAVPSDNDQLILDTVLQVIFHLEASILL